MGVKIGQQPVEIFGEDATKAIAAAMKNKTGKAIDVATIKIELDPELKISALAEATKPPKKPAKKPAPAAQKNGAGNAPPKSPFAQNS